jgi:hypothetical protein
MTIEVDTITAPFRWASYLINGDDSGLDDAEAAACVDWRRSMAPWYVVADVEGTERFTWAYRLYGGDTAAGFVVDYIIHMEE